MALTKDKAFYRLNMLSFYGILNKKGGLIMELEALGVNKGKKAQFESKGIFNVEDLIKFLPIKYFDYREYVTCSTAIIGENAAIIGKIISSTAESKYYKIQAVDRDNKAFSVIWFGKVYGLDKLLINHEYVFCGKITEGYLNHSIQLSNPMFSENLNKFRGIFPVYSKIKGMSDEYLKKTIKTAIDTYLHIEKLEKSVLDKFSLEPTYAMARGIHCPSNLEDIEAAQKRMIFDELFNLAFELEDSIENIKIPTDITFKTMNSVKPFLNTLPFNLTDGPESQLETVRAITRKIRKGFLTNSLVQGDVGCGKTFVALLLMLLMAENGYQSVLMAPTTVLANQHYSDIVEYLKDIPFAKPILLTAGLKKKEKDAVLKSISSGEATIIIGTHAVISDGVEFKNLGLSIIDEEHRFGVNQRTKIKAKVGNKVHTVTMSATPIPRSLGLSLYGEGTDIYTITQMPAGRKNVITAISTDMNYAYDFIEKEVSAGHQAYIVCPLIDESTSEKMEGVQSVEETFLQAKAYYSSRPDIKIGVINGKMKASEISEEIDKFTNGTYNVMISTTIIEVGVNVPNSTIIVIKNAERFGLAQLHQLRGRVGRGKFQSYCVLVSDKEAVPRLEVMTSTTNGFVIAEEDLKLRGMGDFIGTKQSGTVKNVMLMLSNRNLYDSIKMEVKEIYKSPERLKHYQSIEKLSIDNPSV